MFLSRGSAPPTPEPILLSPLPFHTPVPEAPPNLSSAFVSSFPEGGGGRRRGDASEERGRSHEKMRDRVRKDERCSPPPSAAVVGRSELEEYEKQRKALGDRLRTFNKNVKEVQRDRELLSVLEKTHATLRRWIEISDAMRRCDPVFSAPVVFQWNNGLCAKFPREAPKETADANQYYDREWSNCDVHETAMWLSNLANALERYSRAFEGKKAALDFRAWALACYEEAGRRASGWVHPPGEPAHVVPFGCSRPHLDLSVCALRARDCHREFEDLREQHRRETAEGSGLPLETYARLASLSLAVNQRLLELVRLSEDCARAYTDRGGNWQREIQLLHRLSDEYYVRAYVYKARCLVHKDQPARDYTKLHCAAWHLLHNVQRGKSSVKNPEVLEDLHKCLAVAESFLERQGGLPKQVDAQLDFVALEPSRTRLPDGGVRFDLGALGSVIEELTSKVRV